MKKKKRKLPKVLLVIGITFLIFAVIGSSIVLTMRAQGKKSLMAASVEEDTLDEEEKNEIGAEVFEYKGKTYTLNKDIVSILFMGIDKEGEVTDAKNAQDGGQADALFLAVINPHSEAISIYAINRNSMAYIETFDREGNYTGLREHQIAVAHGFGDGREESCERQVRAVSRMFYDLPINAYVSINMEAIKELNDAIGGVDVVVLDDIIYPEYDMDLHQGDNVHLMGDKAYWYVRLRNENVFGSANLRLERQKQYLTAFALTVRNKTKEDLSLPLTLYQTISEYMVTNIDVNRLTYLVTECLGYQFSMENIYSMQGETIETDRFEEFYPDEEALKETLIKLFYEEQK